MRRRHGCSPMGELRVSVICTTKNEESSIRTLIDSLMSQSRLPDEIIFVDAGSTDQTVEIIHSYNGSTVPIRVIIKKGANRAVGRNIAIQNARNDFIASTDAGSRVDRNWLKTMMDYFERDSNVDVVSGVYYSVGETIFEKCVVELTSEDVELWTADTFLPSSRSIAFKKDAWKLAGGYPEHLVSAEDTFFDLELRRKGCKFALAKDAVVSWRVRGDVVSLFNQYYEYNFWDAVGGIRRYSLLWTHLLLAFLCVLVAQLNLFWGLALLLAYPSYYVVRYGMPLAMKFWNLKCLVYGPAIAMTLAWSVIISLVVLVVRKR